MPSMEVRPPWGNASSCKTDQNSGIVDSVATLDAQLNTMLNKGKGSRRLLENRGRYKKGFLFSRNKNVCEYCDRRFNEYSNLIKHRRIHTGSKPYKCELCAKDFTQSSNLNVHRKRCKGPDLNQPQFVATTQIKNTGSNWNSKRKLIAKAVPGNLKTGFANTKNDKQESHFSQAKDLSLKGISPRFVEHMKISNVNICRQLQYQKCMRQENSSVTNSKNVSSDVPLNTSNPKVLNSSEIPAASLAGTSFAPNSNNNSNKIMQESGSVMNNLLVKRRTYPCEYCSRRFNESSNLIKHRRIHTGQRPYKCTFCGKDFTQSSNLNVHKKICKGHHFSKTALRLDSSIKSARLSNIKFQNKLAKVPRYGAFENSKVFFSQLSSQDSLPSSVWDGTSPSQDVASTSSLTNLMSHLSNVSSSFSSEETQSSHHKYIPLSSQLQNLRSEYSENNSERLSRLNSEEIRVATFTENNNLRNRQTVHTRNEIYKCEFCLKCFKWLSTLNIHRQSCTKNFIHNVDASPIGNDENGPTIKESTFQSQKLDSFDDITKSSFIQQVAVTNNESHIDYIVIDDESDDGNDSDVKGNVQREFDNNIGTSLHSASEMDDVKPVFIKCEPGTFPASESVSTFDNVSLSEVDSKSFFPQIEPFPSAVLEVKQEPIEREHSTPINPSSVKQEICDESYNMSQVFNQSVTFDPRVNNSSFEPQMLSIHQSDLRHGDQETNNQNLMGEDQNLFSDYKSTLEPDLQNVNKFQNTANQNQVVSQSLIRKSFCRLRCHVPSCKSRFFKSVTAYEIHMRVHNGQKPYVCEICKKSFNERSNYTKHLRIHSGYKPYKCTLCNHAFTQSSNLNVHKRKCRGQRPHRITSSSLSEGLLKSNITTTNELNTELSEYNQDSLNARSANSLEHLTHGPQNNVTFLHASSEYGLDSPPLQGQVTVTENISHKDSVRNPIISEYSVDEENVTHSAYKLSDQNFVHSNHLVKPRINNSISKPYKCSFCHRAFIHLMNYNLHRVACRRRSHLMRVRNPSAVVDSEINDTHVSSKHPNGLSSSNPDTCMHTPDVNRTQIEFDHNQIKSSIYFSNRNNLSLISASEFPQEDRELIPVDRNFGLSLSLFEPTESKVNLDKTDRNSNNDMDPDLSLQSASLENTSNALSDHPEVRPSLQIEASDKVNQNPTLSKKDDNCKDLQDKNSPTSIANLEKIFQCKLRNCHKVFHLASELKEHTIRHRKGGVNVCKFCHKQFNESSNLIKHRRIHTGAKPYKCEFCNKFFSQSSNRNVHRKSCSKSFTRNLVSFSGTSNPAKTSAVVKPNLLQCEICQQQFQRISDLYNHKNFCKLRDYGKIRNVIEKKSEVGSNFSESSDCQAETKSPKPSENTNEQSSHFREENLLVSSSHRNPAIPLESISLQKQPLNGQYMFQCPFGQCGKIFKMAVILRRHIVKDHNEKQQYPCEVCGKRFNSLGHLSQHKQIHSGQKQFGCPSCGKHFIQFSHLNNHHKICNGSSTAKDFDYFSQDLAGSDRQNRGELAEKSNSDSDLQITRIMENTSKTSNVEVYNHVINIDDNDEDDGSETVQPPTETILNSSVSLNYVKSDMGDKTCEISSDLSPEHISEIRSVHLDIDSQERRIDYPDVIMIDQSPNSNLQDGAPNQKESEIKNKLIKTVDSILEREVSGTLLGDSVTAENNSIPLSKATSWIGSGAKSNGIYNRPSLSNIQWMDTPTNSSKSNFHRPINNNNNWKPSTVTSLGILTNNPTSKKYFPASNSTHVFFCKVRSCRKALKSEQELRMHQCKRRTYPCEYCQRRFNESSNLIKHRRVHTGHKPYKCKFCGRMFTQSSNLNVHRKVCARKHSHVEQRFTQLTTQRRSTEFVSISTSSAAANVNFHEIDLSEESIADVFKNKMSGTSTCDVDDISDKVEGMLFSGGSHSLHAPTVSPVVVEDCGTITKVEDFESDKNDQQNSGIIVENSLTGEVKLQISEKELSAFGHQQTLPDMTRLTDSLIEFENLQDVPQVEYTPNQFPDVFKKEFDNRQDSDIILSQHETDHLEISNISEMAPKDIYNSTQSVPDLSSQLELASNTLLTHKLNSCTRTLKMGLQLKKHLKRRTYACEFCKRRFNESSNLIKHRRIHLGLRPYKCQHCGRSFTQSSNCNVHKKNCAQKYQLSGADLQNGTSLSDTSHIDPSALQANDINNDQTSCSDNYVISTVSNVTDSAGHYNIVSNVTDSTLTTDHHTAKLSCNANDENRHSSSVTENHTSTFLHNGNSDNELKSSVNDVGPIFSISSVRSLKENTDSDLQFTDTKTEFANTSYTVQGIKPAINLSESGSAHISSSIDENPPSLLMSKVNIPDADLTIRADFTPASHQNSFTCNTAAASRKHNFKEPFVSCRNQNRFQRKYLQCPFCPRLCKNPTDFQRHVRVHTGHKPYKCKICNKRFTDYSNLSKHRRVHTGFKPYKCNLCLRQFSQSSNLNVHRKNCKGVQYTFVNSSFRSNELTSLDNQVILNNLTSQILPTDDQVKLRNSSLSFQKKRSFSSELMVESELSERRPQSRNLISKLITSTTSKSIAQRISMKYLSKIPTRLNKNFSKDFSNNSKPQVFGSKDQRFLNANIHIADKTSTTVPETMTYHQRLNSSDSSLTEVNSCSQVESVDFLDKDRNINSLPNLIADKNNKYIGNVCNKRSNKQTKPKGHIGFYVRQKHYYCEFCNQRFNESSNLSKHRRIHTGQKPYKCLICYKRFTQSSNLNVHKRICKERGGVSGTTTQDPASKSPCDKNMDRPDSSSLLQARCEGDVLETPSKDFNFFQESFRNDQKQLVHKKKTSEEPKRISENENSSKNLVSQPTEMSYSIDTSEASLQNGSEPNCQKIDDFMPDNEGKTLKQLDKVTDCTKNSPKNSSSSPNNKDIFIPPLKDQNCDLLQEKSVQNIELDIPNHNNVIENESHLSSVNTGSVDRSALEEADQTLSFTSIRISNNKNVANKNSQIQRENISPDEDKTDIQDLDVQIMDQSISNNHTVSDVNRKTYRQLLSSQNDPKIDQLTTGQSLTDHTENINKSLTKESHNLSSFSADKNYERSNLHQSAVLNPEQLSDQQIELIQSQTEDHGHQSHGLIFVGQPTVKQEDVFSCRSDDIELVQLPSQQSDVMNSINSAINGILQTEEITSSGDQSSLFQNMAPDWFKIKPAYHTSESDNLNSVSPSNKSNLTHVDSSANQINNIDDNSDDDVIIMDTSANFKPVKTKINFPEEMNKLNKSSYPAVSENDPLSSFVNTIPFQPLVKTEPSNQFENPNNSKTIKNSFLGGTTKPTDFSNCISEKIMQSYQSDDLSIQDCHVSDQSRVYSDPLLPLQVNYPQQQTNSHNLVNKNDDDIAIIDIKSTSPGKVDKDSNIVLFNSNYNPAYFSKSCNASTACKSNNMDTYSEGSIMKQTENRLEHIQESFDYLVPNITDQLLDDGGVRVIEVSCQSKQQNIAPNQSSVYACEFCQESFSTSSSLVNHSCPNTGEKSYICPGCGKAFMLYADVISHKRSCVKVPVKVSDFSVFNNVTMQKDGVSHAGNYRMDTQIATIDLNQWGGEYGFNTESCEKMSVSNNENTIVATQDGGQLLSVNKEKILENSEARNNSHTSKYENQLPEFSPQNLQVTINNYDCFPVNHYNAFNSSLPRDNQPLSGNRSEPFLNNSFTNNNGNPVVDISTILSSSESLPSNNTLSSSTLPLNKMSLSGLPPDDPDFLALVNKHSSFSGNDFLYTHNNNYHPQNSISSHTDSNVLLKDFAVELSSDQTGKYSLSTSSHHTSVSTSLSSSTSSTSFINVLDSAASVSSVPCQYCDKMLNLNELSRHTCNGATQSNNRYACTFCEKTLCDASSLSKHLRIHTGHKPYSCEFCGKAFTQSSNLNVHKRVCKDKDNPLSAT